MLASEESIFAIIHRALFDKDFKTASTEAAEMIDPKININATSTLRGNEGQSILWFAAFLAQCGAAEFLNEILHRWLTYKPNVNLSATNPTNGGITVLWYATRLAELGSSNLLKAITGKWSKLSPTPELDVVVTAGKHKGKSLFYQAVTLSSHLKGRGLLRKFMQNPERLKPIFAKEILAVQTQGLEQLKKLADCPPDLVTDLSRIRQQSNPDPYLSGPRPFHTGLEEAPPISSVDLEELFSSP